MAVNLPKLAISVRQPWAWAIIHGGKDVENRSGRAMAFLKHRGPVCVHASAGMTQKEYNFARAFMAEIGVVCPHPMELVYGGIVGSVTVTDVLKQAPMSKWYMPGNRAIMLADPEPVKSEMFLVKGALGYFKWQETDEPIPAPKAWMLKYDHPAKPKPQTQRPLI